MLHVEVLVPEEHADRVVSSVTGNESVADLFVAAGAAAGGQPARLVVFDLARESANALLDDLREAGVEQWGSLRISEQEELFSDAADEAEQRTPGDPEDAVVWESLEAAAERDGHPTWAYLTFLVLATLIAGIGRYLDQTILVIGAMVVGPEFRPLSALCVGVVRRLPALGLRAAATLAGGFVAAGLVATVLWLVPVRIGWVDAEQAVSGPATDFIVQPNVWSLIVAMLAGVVGILSLTSAKSTALVGVFISVTTVPAAGAAALALATGAFAETGSALLQLGVNLLGMAVAGCLTLAVLQLVGAGLGRDRALR